MAVEQVPHFTLPHVDDGREISDVDFRGRTVLFVLATRDSANQARQVALAVRDEFDYRTLPIVSIVDAHKLPKLMHPVARTLMKKGYQDMAREVLADIEASGEPAPADPADAVIMLVDWEGSVAAGFGHPDLGKDAGVALVDDEGRIRYAGVGMEAAQTVRDLLRRDSAP